MEEDQGRKKEQEKQVIETVENVEEFLAWIKRLTGQFFLYRGLANAKWKVESSAQRRIELSGGESSPSAFQNYINDLLNETRLLGFGDKHGRKLSDLELLAELQHNNAATCLIDFTHNALIALWFACKEESEETGKVVAMATDDDTKFMKINYENLQEPITNFLNKDKLWTWTPSNLNNRILAQQSIFIFGEGMIEKSKYEYKEVMIASNIKKMLLSELEKSCNISEQYLFSDFAGFAFCNKHDKTYNRFTAEYYFSRGVIFHQNGEYKKAEDYYYMTLQLDPTSAGAYNNIGKIMHDLGKHNEAIHNYEKAITCNPNLAGTYNNIGAASFALHDNEGAISYYNKAIELNHQYPEAYVNRGIAKQALGKYEDAIVDFDKAIELRPQYAGAYLNRGIVKQALDKYQETISDFDKAIELNPQYADAFFNRGLINRISGNYREAILDYNRALQYNPDHFQAYNNRGILRHYLKHYEEAILDYNKAIDLNPELAIVYFNRGNTHRVLDHYKLAIIDYNKAIDLNPEYAMAFYNRGIAKRASEDEEGSNADLAKAFEIDPSLLSSGS